MMLKGLKSEGGVGVAWLQKRGVAGRGGEGGRRTPHLQTQNFRRGTRML